MEQPALADLVSARHGHFALESGHHGTLWLELDTLFVRQDRLRASVSALARQLSAYEIETVLGPLTGGAFLAQLLAREMDLGFAFTERITAPSEGLYSARYRVPDGLRGTVEGRRIAIVDDVINAGSAVRATIADLRQLDATVVALGALIVLGNPAGELASSLGVGLESLAQWENTIASPDECLLCKEGSPLDAV